MSNRNRYSLKWSLLLLEERQYFTSVQPKRLFCKYDWLKNEKSTFFASVRLSYRRGGVISFQLIILPKYISSSSHWIKSFLLLEYATFISKSVNSPLIHHIGYEVRSLWGKINFVSYTLSNEIRFSAGGTHFLFSQAAERSPFVPWLVQLRQNLSFGDKAGPSQKGSV